MDEPCIISSEEGLVVLAKPTGWVVHAAMPDERYDLMAWAAENGHPDLAPIHRLDRPTSGVVLASADPELRGALGKRFAAGEVTKRYRVLVHGRARKKGIIRKPLSDGRRGKPLEAVTRYRLVEWLGGFSLLEVRPETGRKHQIRRHLQSLGHAVVGDERYPPRRFRKVPAYPGRLWLHAASVEIDERRYEAPLPEVLAAHLEVLRPPS